MLLDAPNPSSPPDAGRARPGTWAPEQWLHLAALTLTLAMVWMGPDLPGFYGVDAGCYARVAREMAARPLGQWAHITLGGVPFYEHPPLANWLLAGAFRVGGPSAETAWAWARLLTTGTVLVTAAVASALAGPRAVAWAMLGLLSLGDFHYQATNVMLETPLTFLLVLGILAALRLGRARGAAALAWGLLFALALGGGWMVKGPPAAALLAVPLFLAWRRQVGWRAALLANVAAVVCTVALAAGLDLWRASLGLDSFWQNYAAHQVVPSVVEGRHNPVSNPFYYLGVLANNSVSLLVAVPVALGLYAWRRPRAELLLLGLFWCAAVVGGFSVPRQKYNWYIVPIMPAAAWVISFVLDQLVPRRVDRFLAPGFLVLAVAWGGWSWLDHPVKSPRAEMVALSRIPAPPPEPQPVVLNCSPIDWWRAAHLVGFYWQARMLGCTDPPPEQGPLYRFDGSSLQVVRP